MASWIRKNILENPFLNPILAPKAIAEEVRKRNGGDANERVANWSAGAEILPGCNASTYVDDLDAAALNPCKWEGTEADWQDYRRNWINTCVAANNSGVLTSKNKTDAACAAKFDELAAQIQMNIYDDNTDQLNTIKNLINNNGLIWYVAAFLFIGLIVYLLMS